MAMRKFEAASKASTGSPTVGATVAAAGFTARVTPTTLLVVWDPGTSLFYVCWAPGSNGGVGSASSTGHDSAKSTDLRCGRCWH